jgi:hypothetical protein
MKPRARKCKINAEGCELSYVPFNSFQAKCCRNPKCVIENAKVKKSKDYDAKTRQMKAEFNSDRLPHQLDLTQQSFNKMIRALDASLECSTCGKFSGHYELSAGHYLTVASTPELRFDARNCHSQCSGCNSGLQKFNKGDNGTTRTKFEATIVRRYGMDLLIWLKSHHPPKHYTCDDLKALRATFNAECRRIEKGLGPSQDWRALD